MMNVVSMKRESAITFLGITTNAAVAFIITFLIGRGLGAAATGDFFLFTSIFAITASVIGMGADTGLVRQLSAAQATGRADLVRPTIRVALRPVVAAGLVVALMACGLAGVIADEFGEFGEGGDAASTIRVLAVTLLPGALVAVLLGGSRGLGHVLTYTAVQNLFVPFARLAAVAAAVGVASGAGVVIWAWSIPLVVAAVIASALLWRQVGQAVPRGSQDAPPDIGEVRREFWHFALPRGGAIVLERLLDWSDVLIVVVILGAASGGIYGVVTRIVMAGSMLEGALRIVMGPRLSAATSIGDHDTAERMFQRVTVALILLSWPYYIVVAVFAEDILGLFGSEFVDGASALVVLAIAMALRNTMGALQTVLLMTGRSMWQLANKFVQVAVLIVASFVLVPTVGIVGAALAYALGVLVDTALATVQVSRRLGFRSDLRSMLYAALFPVCGVLLTGLVLAWLFAGASLLVRAMLVSAVLAAYVAGVGLVLRRNEDFFERATMRARAEETCVGP